MKSILTLLMVLFPFASLFSQTECKVTISYAVNKTIPVSYTFKTDSKTEGAKYYWYFGNDGKSDSPIPTYTFNSSGDFLIQVKVVSGNTVCYGELKAKFEGKAVITNVISIAGKGKVKKSGTDGCGLLIKMDNGTVLVPKEMSVPFEFSDGQYVELAAELYKEKNSGCTAGIYAKITKISPVVIAAPCIVKIVATKNSTNPVSYTFKTDPQTTSVKSYYWKFGDNTTSADAVPTHVYSKTGSYPVYVIVTGTDGKTCTGELKTEFVATTATTPVLVTLTGKGKVRKTATDACGLTITLESGKVLVPAAESVPFVYTDGQYVELAYQLLDKATGCGSGVAAKITKITAIPTTTTYPCTVKINSVKSSTAPYKYTFVTDPKTEGAKYNWSFGDNSVSDSPSPVHAFTNGGIYTIVVKVTGTDGKTCSGELKAEFVATTTTTPAIATLTGKGKVKKAADGPCGVTITLDGGKIIVPVAESVSFAYVDGQYVELAYQLLGKESECGLGLAAKITKIAAINTTVITPVNCNVKIIATKNAEPGSYSFRLDGNQTYVSYLWQFGDNGSSNATAPIYSYSKTGSYNVNVKAWSSDGKICVGSLSLKYEGIPSAELPNCKGAVSLLLLDPTDNFCNGSATVKLLDENGKELANVKYYWPDGRTGSSVKELCPGKLYTVKATIEGVCQKLTSFTMIAKPVWQSSTLNGQNNFTVVAPIEGVQYQWDFGNGITKTGTSVIHNFQQDGIYDVRLKAVSTSGTSESLKQFVVANKMTNTAVIDQIGLEIYPNPAKEILRVDLNNPVKGVMTVEIKDISGHSVYLEKLNNDGSSHTDINIQNLKAGIYMLRVFGNQGMVGEKKFIKAN